MYRIDEPESTGRTHNTRWTMCMIVLIHMEGEVQSDVRSKDAATGGGHLGNLGNHRRVS